jgi:hypothetical protein
MKKEHLSREDSLSHVMQFRQIMPPIHGFKTIRLNLANQLGKW